LISTRATLTINNTAAVTLGSRTLDNAGTIYRTGGGGLFFDGAVITNEPGALFEIQNNASFSLTSGLNRFDNAGTLRKTSNGTTTFQSSVALNNYGTVEIKAGTILAQLQRCSRRPSQNVPSAVRQRARTTASCKSPAPSIWLAL